MRLNGRLINYGIIENSLSGFIPAERIIRYVGARYDNSSVESEKKCEG